MRLSTLCILTLTVSLLAACDKHESATGAVASGSRPAATAVSTGQPSGPLTAEGLKKANLSIDIYTPAGQHVPIAAALAQAKAKLGEPMFVDKNTYAWGVLSADSCACYQIVDKDGKAYSDGVMSADSNGGKNSAYGECLAKLGKKAP